MADRGTSGASNGRIGGLLSGGKRDALHAVPHVRVVGHVDTGARTPRLVPAVPIDAKGKARKTPINTRQFTANQIQKFFLYLIAFRFDRPTARPLGFARSTPMDPMVQSERKTGCGMAILT